MPLQAENLQKMLQSAHKGYAYELLALEIEVENSKDEKNNQKLISNLSKIIQLYMLGVEVLQSNWDSRYKYFNDKIQSLMKKKHIIEELHIASTGSKVIPNEALKEANKQLRQNRKNQHQINIFMNSDQCDIRKVKQIVKKQQVKLANFQSRLKRVLDSQQGQINQRIQRRKMKSQCYSSRKLDIGSNPPNQKMKQLMNDNDDIFQNQKNGNKNLCTGQRRGSTEKKKPHINI